MHKISREFYLMEDVVGQAKDLLGKALCHQLEEGLICGLITETEAYAGITDRASHAYGGRRTPRTEVMFRMGGIAYIYLCYGIHSLFNVVTAKEGIPHAVLIRGVIIQEGKEIVRERLSGRPYSSSMTDGPGKLSRAMGFHYKQSGEDLLNGSIWIEDRGLKVMDNEIVTGPRIGVGYAGPDASLPYRFLWDHKLRSG